jgi:DnaJ-domain-containing protein 1
MPTIYLKPNSPEFADAPTRKQGYAACEMPGCEVEGTHKAPKHRGLNDYYFFCLPHVMEYNKAWNFFEGLSDTEVQDHLHKSMHGDRPTWKGGVNGTAEEALYDKMWKAYHGDDQEPPKRKESKRDYMPGEVKNTPEFEAMALMGLEPPVDLAALKKRYKDLAKKHHPDLNRGCKKSEELLKQINMAYTILKVAFDAYGELPSR